MLKMIRGLGGIVAAAVAMSVTSNVMADTARSNAAFAAQYTCQAAIAGKTGGLMKDHFIENSDRYQTALTAQVGEDKAKQAVLIGQQDAKKVMQTARYRKAHDKWHAGTQLCARFGAQSTDLPEYTVTQ